MQNLTAFLLAVTAISTAVTAAPRYQGDPIAPLIDREEALNDKCRGGSGDSPDTWDACKQRNALVSEIREKGWCFGGDYQIGSDKEWRPCASTVPPRFDVNAHCQKVSEALGTHSETILLGCLENEQSSYDALKRSWLEIPEHLQNHCASVAKATGYGSYVILHGCIEQEVAAQQKSSKFNFKY